jgi:hypothetical protein
MLPNGVQLELITPRWQCNFGYRYIYEKGKSNEQSNQDAGDRRVYSVL